MNFSFSCEVRPGPQFVLRQYEFYAVEGQQPAERANQSFRLRQFHYNDRDCSQPLYAVTAWGQVRLDRPSWLVPGSSEMEVELHKVGLVPFTEESAKQLEKR